MEYARAVKSFWCFLPSCALSITILGTGAKWLSVLEEKNMKPGKHATECLFPVLLVEGIRSAVPPVSCT